MVLALENFAYQYNMNGKPVFAPNKKGREIGYKVKELVEAAVTFDPFIYHLSEGTHIRALHDHRKNKFFCRVDIERFFYVISRNRVKRALKEIGVRDAERFARWSTVKNPYAGGGYVLPYGFVQSPILATLVLSSSAVGEYLRSLGDDITTSVYMDDVCLSSQSLEALEAAFEGLKVAMGEANFTLKADKTRDPSDKIDIFNCELESGRSEVTPERIAEFNAVARSPESESAFETYCSVVKSATWRVPKKVAPAVPVGTEALGPVTEADPLTSEPMHQLLESGHTASPR